MADASSKLAAGDKIGPYEIVGQLGQGGMATVYKAYQSSLDRNIAVKVMADRFSNDPAFAERFRREARSIARLRHPNILTVHDAGEANGVLYMVMEYIDGQTLRDEMSGKPLPPERCSKIIEQVSAALHYANQQGIVHRDVKPSNVLMDGNGERAVLADFGIAKLLDNSSSALTATGEGMGTPDYMSPEQALGEVLDARSDEYSLAAMAFELFSGRPPYRGDTPITIVMGHISKEIPTIREFNPQVSVQVEAVIRKGLAKKPAERYESVAGFNQALQTALKAEPSTSAPSFASPPSTTPSGVPLAGAWQNPTAPSSGWNNQPPSPYPTQPGWNNTPAGGAGYSQSNTPYGTPQNSAPYRPPQSNLPYGAPQAYYQSPAPSQPVIIQKKGASGITIILAVIGGLALALIGLCIFFAFIVGDNVSQEGRKISNTFQAVITSGNESFNTANASFNSSLATATAAARQIPTAIPTSGTTFLGIGTPTPGNNPATTAASATVANTTVANTTAAFTTAANDQRTTVPPVKTPTPGNSNNANVNYNKVTSYGNGYWEADIPANWRQSINVNRSNFSERYNQSDDVVGLTIMFLKDEFSVRNAQSFEQYVDRSATFGTNYTNVKKEKRKIGEYDAIYVTGDEKVSKGTFPFKWLIVNRKDGVMEFKQQIRSELGQSFNGVFDRVVDSLKISNTLPPLAVAKLNADGSTNFKGYTSINNHWSAEVPDSWSYFSSNDPNFVNENWNLDLSISLNCRWSIYDNAKGNAAALRKEVESDYQFKKLTEVKIEERTFGNYSAVIVRAKKETFDKKILKYALLEVSTGKGTLTFEITSDKEVGENLVDPLLNKLIETLKVTPV